MDERARIRLYMGMPKLFSQSNSVLESAMNAIDGLTAQDGGATQARMVTALQQIDAINTQLIANSKLMLATEVSDEVKFDAIRNDAGLRKVGRYLIHQIAIPLSMNPAVDFFSAPALNATPDIVMHRYD